MPNRLRVLIVEDDADASENLRDILSLDDHQVTLESAAKSALVRAKSGTWDVVILDRNLPDGVADELIPAFKSALPMSEVIVVTGYADLDGTIAALRAGAADYIIKPINPDALRASLIRIAQKRRTEKELREERQFAQTILETAEAIILVLNTHGRIVRFNPYLAELTGYSLEEVADHDWFETFIPEEDRPRIRDVFERTVQQLESRGIINPILTKTGQTCDIRWSNTVLKDMDGKVTGVLTVGLDITDLITAQKRLLQAERLAAIGQTMAGLAHESRNALQRVQNSVELLELELEDHPQALADLAKINRA
ncbi:MAG: PAS domain S-box protein, partial [Planctomycetales bacterium]|nr:PAS domain S-box protein [Planctomycetales bacterium]